MINSAKQNKKEKKRRESKKKVRAKNRNDHGLLTLRERIPKQHNPTTCRQSSVTTTLILRIFDLFVCVLGGTPAYWWSCPNLFGTLA